MAFFFVFVVRKCTGRDDYAYGAGSGVDGFVDEDGACGGVGVCHYDYDYGFLMGWIGVRGVGGGVWRDGVAGVV